MARISTYALDTNLVKTDKWIGTDVNGNNATKNFSLDSVANWLNTTAAIDSQTIRFKYQADAQNNGLDERKKGSLSFSPNIGNTVLFSSITNFVLSAYSLKYASQTSSPDISSFYTTPLIDSYVFISKTDDISIYGIYLWNSAALKQNTTNFWDIGLSLIASNGNLENTKDYFISLLTYDPTKTGGDKTFIFNQGVPATVWNIQHNLLKFPSVSVVNSLNESVICTNEYIDNNNVRVSFSAAFSGKAYLN